MELKIGTHKIDFYNSVNISLGFDAVASSFSFEFYFDPENELHKAVFKPGTYQRVTIDHEGERLITGVMLSPRFTSGAVQYLVTVSGYSSSGVLEDCEVPVTAYPLQTKGLNLQQIAERVLKPFGLKVVVDSIVASKAGEAYPIATAKESATVKDYLAMLAGQKHIMLSHNAQGDLVLTQANTSAAPIYHFEKGIPGVEYELNFNGQVMHSGVTLIKQQTKGWKDGTHKKGNAGQSSVSNPYVPSNVVRPRVNRQTSGKDVDTALAARNMLSDELRGLSLTITLDRWALNGSLVKPGSIISITDPNLFLYNKTRFLIDHVDLQGDNNAETAVLHCVLPEVYGGGTPKNIFS